MNAKEREAARQRIEKIFEPLKIEMGDVKHDLANIGVRISNRVFERLIDEFGDIHLLEMIPKIKIAAQAIHDLDPEKDAFKISELNRSIEGISMYMLIKLGNVKLSEMKPKMAELIEEYTNQTINHLLKGVEKDVGKQESQ